MLLQNPAAFIFTKRDNPQLQNASLAHLPQYAQCLITKPGKVITCE